MCIGWLLTFSLYYSRPTVLFTYYSCLAHATQFSLYYSHPPHMFSFSILLPTSPYFPILLYCSIYPITSWPYLSSHPTNLHLYKATPPPLYALSPVTLYLSILPTFSTTTDFILTLFIHTHPSQDISSSRNSPLHTQPLTSCSPLHSSLTHPLPYSQPPHLTSYTSTLPVA